MITMAIQSRDSQVTQWLSSLQSRPSVSSAASRSSSTYLHNDRRMIIPALADVAHSGLDGQ